MSKDDLIDNRVSLNQCRKAVEALHSHELKKTEKFEENQILPAKEQHIWLNVTVKSIPNTLKLKPVKIPIAHPLVDPRSSSVCLITKDPQREYKDLLEKHNIKFISRVVGIAKLKGKFKPFEARRMLLKENGLFLADDRVIPILPKLLGSKWFEAKKQPIPVNLTRKDLKGELERAISSTYMNQNQGTCVSIKVGKMSQTPAQILDNIKTALPAVAAALKGGWENIQSLGIKTNASVNLPIWTCTLDDAEGGRWVGFVAPDKAENIDVAVEDNSEEMDDKDEKSKKGLKRPPNSDEDDDDEEDTKPKKKAKSSAGVKAVKEKLASISKPSLTLFGKLASSDIDATSKSRKKKKTGESPSSSKKVASLLSVPGPEAVIIEEKSSIKARNTESNNNSSSETSVTPKLSEDKKKKLKTLISVPPSPMLEASSAKKNKSRLDPNSVTSSSKPGPSPSVGKPATPVAVKESSGKDKSKLKAAAPNSVVGKSSKISLTREEVKQKRSAGHGEKKKMIIAKSKVGRNASAKNAVLGKKLARE